jgi:hypothetical protein
MHRVLNFPTFSSRVAHSTCRLIIGLRISYGDEIIHHIGPTDSPTVCQPQRHAAMHGQRRLHSTPCKAGSKCSIKKIGRRLLAEMGGQILLAHQTLDFSDRNALKLAYKHASIISKKNFRGLYTPGPRQ